MSKKPSLKLIKKELRAEMLATRNELSQDEVQEASKKVSEHLLEFIQTHNCKTITVYSAMGNELSLGHFFHEVPRDVHLLSPVVIGKHTMEFVEVKPEVLLADKKDQPQFMTMPAKIDALPKGYTIFEPKDIDMMIIPGIGYDKEGYRLGFGGGFYDRYLARFKNNEALFVGVGYTYAFVEKLPHGYYDLPLNYIITPKEVYKV